jgi:hypothetical protein
MKSWPLIQQIRNYRLLRGQPETRHLAWDYLRSYLAYAAVYTLSLPITLPLALLVSAMDAIGNAGWWINRNVRIPGGHAASEEYHKQKRIAWEAYAPFRK